MQDGISPQMRAIIDVIPGDFASPSADYRAVRRTFAPFHGHPVSDELHIERQRYGGVDCGLHTLRGAANAATAFHLHGGAFVSTGLDEYHFYAEIIARQTGCRVLMPDYRLAPEHPYPGAHDDCYLAWCGAVEDGLKPENTVLLGESCGGCLALGLLLRLRDEGRAMPACFVSLTGWFDLSVAGARSAGHDPFLTPEWVRNRAHDYLQGQIALDDPLVSPAYADLSGLPPMLIQIGECDTVAAGAQRLAEQAKQCAVDVTTEHWPGMVQGWHGLANAGVPEAIEAWASIRRYIARYVAG